MNDLPAAKVERISKGTMWSTLECDTCDKPALWFVYPGDVGTKDPGAIRCACADHVDLEAVKLVTGVEDQ